MDQSRIAVIADIHGNSDALTAVLADIDAQKIQQTLNLGDHFSGPLAARETAEILMSREMISIRGNHDRWLIEKNLTGPSDQTAYNQLSPAHLNWLQQLPATHWFHDIFMCHATPSDDLTYFLEHITSDGQIALKPLAEIEKLAAGIDAPIILCGHTHLPRAVRLPNGQRILNPGSVGVPGYTDDQPIPHVVQTGTPDASYMVLERHNGHWHPNFRLVPYDTTRMERLARDAGRPEWANVISTGWI